LLKHAKSATGKHTGALVDFGKQSELILKIGVSFVSEEGAKANLEKEIPGRDFEQVHQQAKSTWSALLDRVAVEGGTPERRKIFYTGVYHSFVSPTLFSDEDGQYMAVRREGSLCLRDAESAVRELFRLGYLPEYGATAVAV
jgi:putative alpha-1,2-mannosidase